MAGLNSIGYAHTPQTLGEVGEPSPNIENTLQSAICALMDCDSRLNAIDGILSPVPNSVDPEAVAPQGLIDLSARINSLAYRVSARLSELRDKLGN